MADLKAKGETPDILYWVGCAGAFDERYKNVAQAFVKILNHVGANYAILGKEESCTGDPAKRAGNEMLYQMQALHIINILKGYDIKKIVCTCPHCFNIFKNEYPSLGGKYEVYHYTMYLKQLIDSGKLKLDNTTLKKINITYHDPCYLGRGNKIYNEPRKIIENLGAKITEMKRKKSFALCCGAGGSQIFKEAEKGSKEVYVERTEDVLKTKADVVATACPFCQIMFTDGIKHFNKEEEIKTKDIAELVAKSLNL